jgi:hypothetical protein
MDKEAYNKYQREYRRKQYKNDILWLREYKVSVGCIDCGWNKHHAGLELDHREGRASGDMSVSKLMGRGRKRIQAEIDKCDVVCAICHNMRTWERRDKLDE